MKTYVSEKSARAAQSATNHPITGSVPIAMPTASFTPGGTARPRAKTATIGAP